MPQIEVSEDTVEMLDELREEMVDDWPYPASYTKGIAFLHRHARHRLAGNDRPDVDALSMDIQDEPDTHPRHHGDYVSRGGEWQKKTD